MEIFGACHLGPPGISQKDFQAFFDNLSDQQRAEIRSRCAMIGRDGLFAQWVHNLCGKVQAAQNSA